jgi:hypothetical protein
MNTISPQDAFAYWLHNEQPELFAALLKRAVGAPAGLSGITDILRSVGSTLASGVKSVGNFLASKNGQETLTALAGTYAAVKGMQQASVLTQMQRADAGLAPAPITTAYDASGNPVAVYQQAGAQYPMTPDIMRQLTPSSVGSMFRQYGVPIAIGVGLLLVFAMRR